MTDAKERARKVRHTPSKKRNHEREKRRMERRRKRRERLMQKRGIARSDTLASSHFPHGRLTRFANESKMRFVLYKQHKFASRRRTGGGRAWIRRKRQRMRKRIRK